VCAWSVRERKSKKERERERERERGVESKRRKIA